MKRIGISLILALAFSRTTALAAPTDPHCAQAAEGFTISEGGISLNPASFLVRAGGRTARLQPVDYEVFEEILTSGEVFTIDHFQAILNRKRAKPGETDDQRFALDLNNLSRVVLKLRRFLAREFSTEMAARLVSVDSIGYFWIDDPPEIPPGQVRRHPTKPHLYRDGRPLLFAAQPWSLLEKLLSENCRPKTKDEINAALDLERRPLISDETFPVQTYRLRAVLGRDAILTKRDRENDRTYWSVSPELFAVDCGAI